VANVPCIGMEWAEVELNECASCWNGRDKVRIDVCVCVWLK